jgi:conjugation transfer TcpE-like protein
VELPTYTNIWRIEKRLYKLYDFRLPMPLPVGQIAVFAAIAVPYIVALTLLGLSFSHTLLWLYILPPGVLTWLATRPVLESKRLPELVISQVRYVSEPRTWCRMAPHAEKDEITVTGRVWRQARPESAEVLSRSTLEPVALEQAIPVESADLATSPALKPLPVPAARGAAAASGKAAAAGRHAAAAPSGRGRLIPARRPATLAPPAGERAQATAGAPAAAAPSPAAPVPVTVRPPVVPVQVRAPAGPVTARPPAMPGPRPAAPVRAPAVPVQRPAVPAWRPAAPPVAPVTEPATPATPAIPAAPAAAARPAEGTAQAAEGTARAAEGTARAAEGTASPGQARPGQPGPAAPDAPPAERPVVTVTGESPPGRPLRVVERALNGPPALRGDGWRDHVVVVPGGHRPGRPDQRQRDRARAQLPVARSCRIVVLGCTVGAGQTVTTLMTGEVLANLRTDQVAVLDLNPGRGSLADRARTAPEVTQDSAAGSGPVRGSRPMVPSRLEVITRGAADTQGEPAQDDVGRMFELVSARYPLTLADPAPSAVPRVLGIADQLVLVAPASADAASAIAMTYEWLEAHGRAGLAAEAVTVLNGVSRHTMHHVEQAESVARGRCRAIVRVPWDDLLRNPAPERARPPAPVSQPHQAGRPALSPAAVHAYTALAGVLVAGLADAPELRRARI